MSKQLVLASFFVLASAIAGCAGNGGDSCPGGCASSQVCCDGTCVFAETDPNNCGGCGAVCAGTCSSGMCIGGGFDAGPGHDGGSMPQGNCHPTCSADSRCCGNVCVADEQTLGVDGRPANADDPSSPFNNCNGCGLRCDPERSISCSIRPGSTVVSCACGQLGACVEGEVCALSGGSYQCVNTSSDPHNCGELGHACANGETCTAGVCGCGGSGTSCGAGESCCGGSCIDTTADPANCGGCGMACGDNAPTCQDSTCVCGSGSGARACAAPNATTGDTGESCCDNTCVANTASSCGCGIVCDVADDEDCIVDTGFIPGMGGGGGVCCGMSFGGIPGLPLSGFCTGGGGFPGLGDGGLPFPGLGDGGLPFP